MRWINILILFLILLCPLKTMAQDPVNDFVTQNEAEFKITGEAVEGYIPLITKLRTFAVIILLIALVISAIMAAYGKSGLALSVAIAAIILFGGFFIFTMISKSFENPPDLTKDSIVNNINNTITSDSKQPVGQTALTIRAALHAGIDLFTAALIPFIIVYGFLLAIAFAIQGADGTALVAYIIGSIVALSANIIAQVFKIF